MLAPVEELGKERVAVAGGEDAGGGSFEARMVEVYEREEVEEEAGGRGRMATVTATIGADGAVSGARSGSSKRVAWKEKLRRLLHGVVDDMVDNTQFAEKTQRHMSDTIRRYNALLRKVVQTKEGVTDLSEPVDDEFLFN